MSFGEKIKLIFSKAFSVIWDFIKPFIKAFLSDAGKIILEIANEVVTDIVSQKKLPGEEKRKLAFEKIEARVKDLGLDYSSSIINSAIEIAVQKLKSE